MACGSMIKSGIKQTAALKTVESSCCFSLSCFHNTKQGSITPQFTCKCLPLPTLGYKTIIELIQMATLLHVVVRFKCFSDLMLRSKVTVWSSALNFCWCSLNTAGLPIKEHRVHHTKEVFSQLPHAAGPLGTNFSIIQHSTFFLVQYITWNKIDQAFPV